jgi:ribosome biogenesis GTPase / thiamine phosphate phosphatase
VRRPDPAAARVVSAHGDKAWLDATPSRVAQFKGRGLKPVAGDWVRVDWTHDPPVVQEVLTASNTILRSEGRKTKQLAANIDLAVVVVSGYPLFSADLLLRVLASLRAAQIPVVIAVNKADQVDSLTKAREALRLTLPAQRSPLAHARRDTAAICCEISATAGEGLPGIAPLLGEINAFFAKEESASHGEDHDPERRASTERTIALIGQSGMGKSSLLNRLIPGASAQTREISEALQTGKHTTTVSRGYLWPQAPSASHGVSTWVIDTPGFQRFGLAHLSLEEIGACFPEWSLLQRESNCRFHNCRHSHEPGCAVKAEIAGLREKDPSYAEHLESRRQAWLALLAAEGLKAA